MAGSGVDAVMFLMPESSLKVWCGGPRDFGLLPWSTNPRICVAESLPERSVGSRKGGCR